MEAIQVLLLLYAVAPYADNIFEFMDVNSHNNNGARFYFFRIVFLDICRNLKKLEAKYKSLTRTKTSKTLASFRSSCCTSQNARETLFKSIGELHHFSSVHYWFKEPSVSMVIDTLSEISNVTPSKSCLYPYQLFFPRTGHY